MKTSQLKIYFDKISQKMNEKKDELVKLDQSFGDGDLGISMASGFKAISTYADELQEEDAGKYFMQIARHFNENAPSSLGTIVSFMFMGMAKSLKGKTDINLNDLSEALKKGAENIQEKAGSKIGQKTMIDALIPAVEKFENEVKKGKNLKDALKAASIAAETGAQKTKEMIAVHGRAAYHGEKTLGHIDGGALMVAYVFKALIE